MRARSSRPIARSPTTPCVMCRLQLQQLPLRTFHFHATPPWRLASPPASALSALRTSSRPDTQQLGSISLLSSNAAPLHRLLPLRHALSSNSPPPTATTALAPFDASNITPALTQFVADVRKVTEGLSSGICAQADSSSGSAAGTALADLWRAWPPELPLLFIPLTFNFLRYGERELVEEAGYALHWFLGSNKPLGEALVAAAKHSPRMHAMVAYAYTKVPRGPSSEAPISIGDLLLADGTTLGTGGLMHIHPALVAGDMSSLLPDEPLSFLEDMLGDSTVHRMLLLCPEATALEAAIRCLNLNVAAAMLGARINHAAAHESRALSRQLSTLLSAYRTLDKDGAWQGAALMCILSKHHIASEAVRAEWLARQLTATRLDRCDFAALAHVWHGGQTPSPTLPLWRVFLAVVRRWARQPWASASSLRTMLDDVIGRSRAAAAAAVAVPMLRAVAADDAPLCYYQEDSMLPLLHVLIARFGWRDIRDVVLPFAARLTPEDIYGLAATLKSLGHHTDAQAAARVALSSKHPWTPATLLTIMTECDEPERVSLAKSMQAHYVRDAVQSTREILATRLSLTRSDYNTMLRALVVRRLAQLTGEEGATGWKLTQPAAQLAKGEAADLRELLAQLERL